MSTRSPQHRELYKHLDARNRKLLKSLTSPICIQRFLNSIPYSTEERYRSPLNVLRDRTAHCFDGAMFAAAALNMLGYPPLLVALLPNERDDDHMIAPFTRGKSWGAVAQSNYSGLRYREPVYRSLHELVMSYFEPYFNAAGERTLRAYTRPLNLRQFDHHNWMINDAAMDVIGEKLDRLKPVRILDAAAARMLTKVDERTYKAGMLGAKKAGLFKV